MAGITPFHTLGSPLVYEILTHPSFLPTVYLVTRRGMLGVSHLFPISWNVTKHFKSRFILLPSWSLAWPPSKTHELVHYLLLSLFYYTSSYWWPCLISHIGLGTTWRSGKMTEPGPRSDGGEWWWNLMFLGVTWQAFYTHQFISFSELFYRAFLFIWQKRKVKLRNLGPAAWMKARTKFRYLPPKFFLFPLCCVAFFQALKTWVPAVLPFKLWICASYLSESQSQWVSVTLTPVTLWFL